MHGFIFGVCCHEDERRFEKEKACMILDRGGRELLNFEHLDFVSPVVFNVQVVQNGWHQGLGVQWDGWTMISILNPSAYRGGGVLDVKCAHWEWESAFILWPFHGFEVQKATQANWWTSISTNCNQNGDGSLVWGVLPVLMVESRFTENSLWGSHLGWPVSHPWTTCIQEKPWDRKFAPSQGQSIQWCFLDSQPWPWH